jgi:hypothetical protein
MNYLWDTHALIFGLDGDPELSPQAAALAQAGTIRWKFLKIGAVVLRNTRRVKLLLASGYPYQRIFGQVFRALGSG